ncbi:MAG: phosphotransferase [Chloroflexi bacterium B3_Chlor]|nr:MAG: phosphotransferase [Chloroflexi bacterium B3_Chlor]
MIKVDIHVHSCYSKDGLLTPEEIVARCREKGLGALAITDHDTIAGAVAVRDVAPFPVIVGQEVSTLHGEVIGLFLEEEVPRDLSPSEAVACIKEQGGLAGVPHPFDRLRGETLGQRFLKEIAAELDFIECFNSRVTLSRDNGRAQEFAVSRGLPCTAGSDAHSGYELGRAYVEMSTFMDRGEFLERLAQGRIVGNSSPFWVHFFSVYARMRRSLVRG